MRSVRLFLKDVWDEVHPTHGRVVWPGFDKVVKSTWVVITMSFVMGIFLWIADVSFGKVISEFLFG